MTLNPVESTADRDYFRPREIDSALYAAEEEVKRAKRAWLGALDAHQVPEPHQRSDGMRILVSEPGISGQLGEARRLEYLAALDELTTLELRFAHLTHIHDRNITLVAVPRIDTGGN